MADKREQIRLGFLSAVSLGSRGHVGGLLVTNQMGRPLEFQCTAPVAANRTQEILYGHTLQPYLLGEVIGKTLVEKMSVKPDVVVVDHQHLLAVRPHTKLPCVLVPVLDTEEEMPQPAQSQTEIATTGTSLRIHPDFPSDQPMIDQLRKLVPAEGDLAEPLIRVREALREATGTAAASTGTHSTQATTQKAA